MKTGFFIVIIGIVLTTTIILFSYGGVILFDEHYEIEIVGLDDIYTTDEAYFFDYHVSGYGDACAKITVNYPDEDGKTMTKISMPSCVAERNFVSIDTSSFSGILGNVTVKIPGTYSVSVMYDPIGSLLSATKTKEFEVIDNFEVTFGGPGNRHPTFLGYVIPEICTNDMIEHLKKYSSMFDRNMPYTIEDIGLENNINKNDFDTCVKNLLEKNPKDIENEN